MDEEEVRGGYPDPSLLALPGLDRMRTAFTRQSVPPPIAYLCGLKPVTVGHAAVTFSMPASPWLQSDAGVYFAGTAALVADAPLGGAVLAPLGPGQVIVTSELSFNFLRPMGPASERLTARARPIEVGRKLGLAEALVEDGLGRVVAHCTTRCFIISIDVPPLEGDPPKLEWPEYPTPNPYERPLPEGSTGQAMWDEMTFLEILEERRGSSGPPAPFEALFGLRDAAGEPGRFSSACVSSPWLTSPAGSLYGGFLAYFADTLLTGAMSTTLSTTEVAAPLDLKVLFIRPVWPDGRELLGEATVVHRGRSFAAARAEIKNADGKTVVIASSSAAIRSGGSWNSFVVVDETTAPTLERQP